MNDASPDDTWNLIKEISSKESRVKGINLSRNFGQHYAIAAGLEYSIGDWVVVMDCDLQDLPEEIPRLLTKAQEGYDMVVGLRIGRKDSIFKKIGSRIFYLIFNYLAATKVDHRIGNFGIYSRKVVNSICSIPEQHRSFGLLALWVGFKRGELQIRHSNRKYGESSYGFRDLITLAIDSMVAHSNRLLFVSVKAGIILAVGAVFFTAYLMLRYLILDVPVAGWTSVMVSLYLIAGLIFVGMGVVGIYIGKIFDQVKNRPLYIVSEKTF